MLNRAPSGVWHGLRRAGAATAASVAEANVAAAAALAAAFEAIAAGLEHLAALGVAAGAGDAAAVLGVFALAVTAAEREIADLDAVPGAAAGARAVAQRLTKVLQRGARRLVVTFAEELEAPLALFKPHFAAGHDADIRRSDRGGRPARKGCRRSSCGKCTPRTF